MNRMCRANSGLPGLTRPCLGQRGRDPRAAEPAADGGEPAMQADAEPHDTPARMLRVALGGAGVGCTDHALPFHRSARMTWSPRLPV